MKTILLILIFLMIALSRLAAQQPSSDSLSVSDPVTFGGLTIWMVETPEKNRHPYLTLEEALRNRRAVIHENNSQKLWIENLSDTDLFIQSTDLIKGGQQDRMVASDMIIPSHETSRDLNVYCIEHDRSFKRGNEPIETFSSSEWMAPLAHTRLVARHELTGKFLTPRVGGITAPDPEQLKLLQSITEIPQPFGVADAAQESIWNDVKVSQSGLTSSLKDSVTRNQSPSSLELALDANSVAEREHDFQKRFASLTKDEKNAVGFIYAIGGKIRGGDIYGSRDLFNSMWPKLIRAASAEAIVENRPKTNADSIPSIAEVMDFIESARHGKSTSENSNDRTFIEATKSGEAFRFTSYDMKFDHASVHEEILANDNDHSQP